MPRYVSKEDVEKGLVDPHKAIQDQPEYKKKLEVQAKQKNPKNEKKKEYPKRQRNDRPEFNWNKKYITEETPIPEEPKKKLEKPDVEKFREQMKKLKQEKDQVYLQRKKLIDEQKILIQNQNQNKKSGFNALSQFSGQLKEKNNLKNIVDKEIKTLEQKRQAVEKQIKNLKDINNSLRKPTEFEQYSLEELDNKANNLQVKLSTANIDKKQQARIHNQIQNIKRAKLKARPQIEIKTEISKNDDAIKIQTEQSRGIKKEIDQKYKEIKPLKAEIYKILEKKKEQQGSIVEVRSVEQIRAEYDGKIKKVEAKRQQLDKKMDQLRAKHNKQFDEYQDQQDLIRYIQYVKDQKEWLLKKKEERIKREKQKEEYEKKKKKQFEQREKKRQQRKAFQEKREREQKQRKEKLQKERQAFINRNPNHAQIELAQFMINYCNAIRPSNNNQDNQESKVQRNAQDIKLEEAEEWKKQAKRGCEVIVGKKSKIEDDAPKKVKKEKKRNNQEEDGTLNHAIDTINRFHQLNILPPSNLSELDQTIQQLKQKIDLFNKPSEEEITAFKAKSEKEFDRIHGFRENKGDFKEKEDDEEQKPAHDQKKKKKHEKLELKGADFPGLN